MINEDSKRRTRKQQPGDLIQEERLVHTFLDEDFDELLEKKSCSPDRAETLGDEVRQIRCYSCGKETPATVSTCLNCGAPHDVEYEKGQPPEDPDTSTSLIDTEEEPDEVEDAPISLIDAWDEELF